MCEGQWLEELPDSRRVWFQSWPAGAFLYWCCMLSHLCLGSLSHQVEVELETIVHRGECYGLSVLWWAAGPVRTLWLAHQELRTPVYVKVTSCYFSSNLIIGTSYLIISYPHFPSFSRQSLHPHPLNQQFLSPLAFTFAALQSSYPDLVLLYPYKDVPAPVSVSHKSHPCCLCPPAAGAASARLQHPLCCRHSALGERRPANEELRSPCRLSHPLQ